MAMGLVYIALLGKEPMTVYYPINDFSPDIVYIIGTSENSTIADRLVDLCQSDSRKVIFKKVNPLSFESSLHECEVICNENEGASFLFNITSGTKPMTLGAFVVAVKRRADIIYTDSKNYFYQNEPFRQEKVSNLETDVILQLQGQDVRKKEVWEGSESQLKQVSDSRAIGKFILSHKKIYEKMRKHYESNHSVSWEYGDYEWKADSEGMTVWQISNNKTLLEMYNPTAVSLMYEGRWWEYLVIDAVVKWADGKGYMIWHDVVIDSKSGEDDKNEIDVLVNIGTSLLIIECKSGNFTQDNVYKLNAVKNIIGSNKSKGVLVSLYPVCRKSLKEKIKEMQIDLVVVDNLNNIGVISQKLDSIVEALKL